MYYSSWSHVPARPVLGLLTSMRRTHPACWQRLQAARFSSSWRAGLGSGNIYLYNQKKHDWDHADPLYIGLWQFPSQIMNMIRADGQSPGKDFERLRLLFQENLSDNPWLAHGGHWDWWGQAETVARRLVHLLKVHMASGDVALTESGRKISSTSASAGGRPPPRQNWVRLA